MNIAEVIKKLLGSVRRLEKKLDLILSAIVVQQKTACEMVNISPDTVRARSISGQTEILQAEGSRLNYLTLKETLSLKPKSAAGRRRTSGDEELYELFLAAQYGRIDFKQFKQKFNQLRLTVLE